MIQQVNQKHLPAQKKQTENQAQVIPLLQLMLLQMEQEQAELAGMTEAEQRHLDLMRIQQLVLSLQQVKELMMEPIQAVEPINRLVLLDSRLWMLLITIQIIQTLQPLRWE